MEKPIVLKRISNLSLCLSLVALLVACAHFPAEPRAANGHHPWSLLHSLYEGPLNHLEGVRGGVCPMYPSCSVYSRLALEKHGPIKGWVMTLDRLMRCGRDEIRHSPRILVDGRIRFYDPLENNDFWWYRESVGKGAPDGHSSDVVTR